ncbi:MAG: lamin tail domain-containing protein [Candidatus Pacebacteria bacterium]|nr:lamin tail domain-containing protein [Candidatus Paceibacterota bacterium]
MVSINEWFPDPVGTDAAGEFVELYNSGNDAVNLTGWKLGTGTASTTSIIPAKTKPFSLAKFSVPARGYLVLARSKTKLSLKNTDGGLLLYGPDGTIVDRASFAGTAPEGKSFSRVSQNASTASRFAFTSSTPGAANAKFESMISSNGYPTGIPLNARSALPAPGTLALGTAFLVAIIFFHVFKKNEHLSNFLFGRDEASR